MYGAPYFFLTCIQISHEAGKLVWYSHLLKNFSQFVMIHTVKGFGVVNKAEVGVCLELSFMIQQMLATWSVSAVFSKSKLNICKFLVHVLLKPGLENFEHYFASVWDECNCVVAWTFFVIAFLWDWNENWLSQSCGHCWVFQICWHFECSTFTASSFRIWNS